MWKTLATVLAGVVPGIFIGMAIAAIFVSAPTQNQLKLSREAEKRSAERAAQLNVKLTTSNESLKALRQQVSEQGEDNVLSIQEIRDVCAQQTASAVKAGQAIARITTIQKEQAQNVKDLAASCPANVLIDTDELRLVAGQR